MVESQSLVKEVEWLKDATINQGEKITELEIRLNKKHEEIAEIKQEENKKRERELQFLENMTRTSALLDKVALTVDNTQKEINKIKEDIDVLKSDNASRQGSVDTSKYLFGVFCSLFGGVVVFIITNMLK